ncbi:MAG: hypothetical protein ACW963_07665 [Candidatus Sifarchaeia archaeon]|jgi:hypothetical protein
MKKSLRLKIMPGITMALFALLMTTLVNAQSTQETYSSTTSRVGFFLGGGFAHSESRGGMIDLKSELQFSISKKIRFGLGIGYMSDFHGMHMSGGMMGGMMGGMNNGFSGHRHSFRVVPITSSIYYLLPLSPNVDVFMTGGGGYYIASFRDVSTENKNAFGPHVGIGFDFKATHKINIITEAVYRFVNLKDFTSQLHQGFRELEGEQHEDGFWHFHHQHEEWHFHEEHEDEIQVLEDSSPFNISLNGFSIRAEVRFGF